MYKSFT